MPSAPVSERVAHLVGELSSLPDPLAVPTLASVLGAASPRVRLRPPGSKSLANRALVLAALGGGRSLVRGVPTGSEDLGVMVSALERLGARIDAKGDTLAVRGVGGRLAASADLELDVANAGTAMRFLAAAACLGRGPVVLTGSARMLERPIGDLVPALLELGATVQALGEPGRPPLRITPAADPPERAEVFFESPPSSQFVSALLLIGPFLTGGVSIEIEGEVTSAPYVRMTLGLLDELGARVRSSADLRVLRVGPGRDPGPLREGFTLDVEPDASGASVFWAAAAASPGSAVTVCGFDDQGLQGDLAFPSLLARMGAQVTVRERGQSPDGPSITVAGGAALRPIMADMRDMPDAAMALVVLASLATGRSVVRGLHTLRVKETDRLHALKTELERVGVEVELDVLGEPGAITIDPPAGGIGRADDAPAVVFQTYDDHRMAMALSLIALRRPNVRIANPKCVAKTYPGFWEHLAGFYASPEPGAYQ